MSESIIVNFESQTITQSGHTCYHTVDGKKYYVNKSKTIPIPLNTDTKILCSVQDIGGKKLHWINWAGPVGEPQEPNKASKQPANTPKIEQNVPKIESKPVQASKYSEADKQAFKAKSEQIRDISALNNSVGMVQACSNSITDSHFANMKIAEVVKYWKDLQNTFYKEYKNQLSSEYKQSGIEVSEEVTSEEYNSGEDME